MNVFRCYTEKKNQFDIEASSLLSELIEFVKIESLESLRILNRYDIEGIDDDTYEKAKFTIFAKPQIDTLYNDNPPKIDDASWSLPIEALPGQYDQRAHACAESLQLLTPNSKLPLVKTAKLYVFYGNISAEDKDKLQNYLINPLESQISPQDKPETLAVVSPKPDPVKAISGFIAADEKELHNFSSEYNLAMDIADIKFLQKYFRDTEKRDPTETELRVIDTYWSDHCRHTTFFTHLTNVDIHDSDIKAAYDLYLNAREEVYGEDESKRPQTLMDIATIAAKTLSSRGKLTNIDISDEVNACSIHIDALIDGKSEDWLLMFKNETHNHPTEVEPFGGAATCVGGAIRDPLSGRAYVYQAMRITGSDDPRADIADTLPGKIPQRKLTLTAARGNSSYGNQIGLPAGLVHEIYHPGYVAKRMELGAVVGAVKADNVVREVPSPGDKVILLGGRTGRDGVGGATGSSKTQTNKSVLSFASEVQKGNAQEERKIQRLFLDPAVTKMIKKCNDFGAGGVSVAVGELADGIDIDLSLVRLKYDGLNGTEIATSESQERMAIIVAPENVDQFIIKAVGENLEAYVIAEITEAPRMVMRHDGEIIVDLSREFLSTNGAVKQASIVVEKADNTLDSDVSSCSNAASNDSGSFSSSAERLKALVSDLRFCSQRGLYEMFDGTVGASGVLMKNGGKTQDTPTQVMASLLPVSPDSETTTCSVMAFGFDPYLSSKSPYQGAKTAVITSVAKLVASGCDPTLAYLSFQEYFERLGNDPLRWGKPFSALLGAFEAQMKLGLAAIGGKDSMSGSYNELDVPPTLVSFAIAPNDVNNVISPEFKKAGNDVVVFNPAKSSSEYMSVWKNVRKLIEQKIIVSAWAITDGGAIEGIFKMAIGNEIGFEALNDLEHDFLFGYIPGAIVAEVTEPVTDALVIGRTISQPIIKLNDELLALDELRALWAGTLENVFPTVAKNEKTPITAVQKISYTTRSAVVASEKFAKPRVLILAAPGSTGELDAARAVNRAGGVATTVLIRNMSPYLLSESIMETFYALEESQILILPAASTFGDEPDGAAKFLSAFLRIPRITDTIHKYLNEQGGLILGIGNGFQALVNTGLIPFGEIIDPLSDFLTFRASDRPVFIGNVIGRHQATYVNTRVASANSPWMNLCEVGDIYKVPVSHGEGRLIASDNMLNHLIENGQIATQYTDENGNPSMNTIINPNGSFMAIEGLFCPDGRIFGKMGHFERYDKHIAKNIYGNKHQPVIESGIKYLK